MKPLKRELRLIAAEVKRKVQQLLKFSNTPSKPGQPPSLIDGNLAKAINYKIKGNKVTITASAFYSVFLEAGASNTGKSHKGNLLPRPFMSVVLDEMKEEITARIIKAVNEWITTK